MEYIKRDIDLLVLEVSKNYSAVIITGPRQVGKTTTLRRLLGQERRFVSLDNKENRQLAQTDPELFLSLNPAPVIIDEVQYAPELFPYIKMEIDNGVPPGSYLMTGSQMYQLMKLAGESLAGRVAILRMLGLSQHEIYGCGKCLPFAVNLKELQKRVPYGNPTDVRGQFERIWSGSLPAHISGKHSNRDVFYSSYIDSYIDRDIKDMVYLKDEYLFRDFVRAAACRAGEMLNIHAIATDVGVSDETAKTWLGYMEKSGVIFYLRPFSNNLLNRTIKKAPKLYFFDTGLVAYLTKYSSPEILMNGAINGAILENYVVSEIIKTYTNNGLPYYAHYYRDIDNKEIDIILESDGELHPIEIKKTASPQTELVNAFKVLDKASIPRGVGAVICTKKELSALDKGAMIVPVWAI
ncbi:MAG: ATP-binding protein [Oscillospiraceae bacterium]|jgi:predicted AAA+ superfamily ATPase|nr:ATP-binding protein [Oscillospiraceae bacterium]